MIFLKNVYIKNLKKNLKKKHEKKTSLLGVRNYKGI